MMHPLFVLALSICGALWVGTIAVAAGAPPTAPLSQAAPPEPVPAQPADDEAARATFELVCGACHDPAVATTTMRTRQELGEMLDLMVSFGASASDDQFRQIQRYLGRRYGKVNVNLAPADELQLVLDVTPEVAQAIIDYRSTTRLTSADDLTKVPGLDASKVEALEPHLQF
jgi:hypothetical protein